LGAALFMFLARGADNAVEATLLICGALGMLAFTWSGFGPNHLDIAPKHAGFLLGVSNTAGSLPGVIGVIITGWLLDVTGTYASAFLLASGICVFGAIVWLLFASGERQI
jgi:ACS family sodium-dependent inorganic phosphate cotransporter